MSSHALCYSFFFNDTATTEIYTLSLHDALPISQEKYQAPRNSDDLLCRWFAHLRDRKSTRLNSSHANISYAVFCLKKTKERTVEEPRPTTVSGTPSSITRQHQRGRVRQRGPSRTLAPHLAPDDPHLFFFFNDTATTEIYTLSLHDALPI